MQFRKQSRRPASPAFLFSTWPQVELHNGICYVMVIPSDSSRMQEAVNRLNALRGGTIRMTAGTYDVADAFYIDA